MDCNGGQWSDEVYSSRLPPEPHSEWGEDTHMPSEVQVYLLLWKAASILSALFLSLLEGKKRKGELRPVLDSIYSLPQREDVPPGSISSLQMSHTAELKYYWWHKRFADTSHRHTSKMQRPVIAVVVESLNCVQLYFAVSWTIARQAPLSMGFSRQEYWSGLSCSPPGDLPDSGIEPMSPALEVISLPLSHQGSPNNNSYYFKKCLNKQYIFTQGK